MWISAQFGINYFQRFLQHFFVKTDYLLLSSFQYKKSKHFLGPGTYGSYEESDSIPKSNL